MTFFPTAEKASMPSVAQVWALEGLFLPSGRRTEDSERMDFGAFFAVCDAAYISMPVGYLGLEYIASDS
jgi:hypothetical protein